MRLIATYMIAFALWAVPALAVDGFFAVAPDVPLLPNFEELTEQESLFDAPGGRIAHLVATGPGSTDQINDTYAESLAALGWQPAAAGGFVREGEALHLSIESLNASDDTNTGGQVRVEISITPRD